MRQCTNGSAAKAPGVPRPKRRRVRGQSVIAPTDPAPKRQTLAEVARHFRPAYPYPAAP